MSGTIEKHLFPKRTVSPFVGFGASIEVYSQNVMGFRSSSLSGQNIDNAYFYWSGNFYWNGGYYTNNIAHRQDAQENQTLYTSTKVNVSAHILVGVEYFILPALSLTAKAMLVGGVGATLQIEAEQSKQQSSLNYAAPIGTAMPVKIDSKTITNQTIAPQASFGAGAYFSSSVAVSFYFGRGALQDIANALNNMTLFEW